MQAVMQATVATFDQDTGGGTVLTDDGRRIPFDPAAFAAGGLRLLRPGQRVRMDLADGRVVRITILTLAWPSPAIHQAEES